MWKNYIARQIVQIEGMGSLSMSVANRWMMGG